MLIGQRGDSTVCTCNAALCPSSAQLLEQCALNSNTTRTDNRMHELESPVRTDASPASERHDGLRLQALNRRLYYHHRRRRRRETWNLVRCHPVFNRNGADDTENFTSRDKSDKKDEEGEKCRANTRPVLADNTNTTLHAPSSSLFNHSPRLRRNAISLTRGQASRLATQLQRRLQQDSDANPFMAVVHTFPLAPNLVLVARNDGHSLTCRTCTCTCICTFPSTPYSTGTVTGSTSNRVIKIPRSINP